MTKSRPSQEEGRLLLCKNLFRLYVNSWGRDRIKMYHCGASAKVLAPFL